MTEGMIFQVEKNEKIEETSQVQQYLATELVLTH